MKKVLSLILIAGCLASCSSGSALSSASKVTSSLSKISNVANTVNEILTVTNTLGLTNTQKSALTKSLTSYINQYQQLSSTANAVSQIAGLKSNTLSTISSSLGASKYDAFLGILKATTAKNSTANLSADALSVLTSLL